VEEQRSAPAAASTGSLRGSTALRLQILLVITSAEQPLVVGVERGLEAAEVVLLAHEAVATAIERGWMQSFLVTILNQLELLTMQSPPRFMLPDRPLLPASLRWHPLAVLWLKHRYRQNANCPLSARPHQQRHNPIKPKMFHCR
jgi:hypothetical protein